jgi:single-stranded-DNA-specific exonuclease
VPEAPALLDALPSPWADWYAARGVLHPDELDYALEHLPDPACLAGIEAAVERLAHAIEHRRRIVVVADYDCDGATACAVALRGLTRLGAETPGFIVPDRARHGYGLTPGLVAEMHGLAPDLLLTVDNGIAALDGVDAARAKGWPVVVTDHHLPGPQVPAAAAIVNPNQAGDGSGLGRLAGVGVVFLLLSALRRSLFAARRERAPTLADLLPLVAVGTIGDVVALDAVNRLLVHQGLLRLRAGQAPAGLLALAAVARRALPTLSTADVAFGIAPRLNAAGRIDDMTIGIRCLLTDDPAEARQLAVRLEGLNQERRRIQSDMQAEAETALLLRGVDDSAEAVCVHHPDWHAGVVGVLAGRLKDALDRPVVAFAPGEPGQLRGSARSVSGVHIRDAIAHVDACHPGLIGRFGGHAMAAGLSLPEAALPVFETALAEAVGRLRDRSVERGCLVTDGPLAPAAHTTAMARELALLPWGQAFSEPLLEGVFRVDEARVVGERHLRLRLSGAGGGPWPAIAFGQAGFASAVRKGGELRVAYRLALDDFRGESQLQLRVEALEP